MTASLAATMRAGRGLASKRDIAVSLRGLGLSAADAVAVGDDCAAIPDGDGWLLLAIEGFINEFVAADPWFAGWCGVMVNLSDVAAMGGRAIAVVDALWAADDARARDLLAGLRDAAARYAVPLLGGHTNLATDRPQLAVAILGRATHLLTSFAARAGDVLMAAIDLRGRYRAPFANFDAATDAPADRLRGDIAILPALAAAGLVRAAKDISQGGLVGTACMMAEASAVGLAIDAGMVPRPADAAIERWLATFPSFGFLLAVAPAHVAAVRAAFQARDIAVGTIGDVTDDHQVQLDGATVWDFAAAPLMDLHAGPPCRS